MTTLAQTLRPKSTLCAIAVVCLTACEMAHAQGIWTWTDDQGKVHYADVVPERYRSRAKPVSSDPSKPSAEEQRAALARAASDKSKSSSTIASSPAPAAAPSASASRRRPVRVPDPNTDCETWARLYQESLECFGPFRTTRGATRPEAFEHCAPVDAPPSRCRQHFPD